MGKLKIRSKTPQKEIIKTKIPADADESFDLPPKKHIDTKTPGKHKIIHPKKSGLKQKDQSKVDKNSSFPQITKKKDILKNIPVNNGIKIPDEVNNRKKNSSLPKIERKVPKKSATREFTIKNDSLKKFNKKNNPLIENVKNKSPSNHKQEKKQPPKIFRDLNPPKSKIKDKKPT
ncbi:MAG: hypothetical protein ACW98A_17890 [Candidatus Hodarchaeales archaeon]|jgi:hypothetical protein